MNLDALIGAQLFAWLLVFARVGAAFMLLPGFGDGYVSMRIRLFLALGISLALVPVLGARLPPQPPSVPELLVLLATEVMIGAFLGTIARVLMGALETAGMVISLQTGLAGAIVLSPAQATQGTLPGVMLDMIGLVLLFVTDLHHLLILAIADSYAMLAPGGELPTSDFAETVVRLVSASFRIGVEMAAPFIVVGIVFNLGLAVLSRLMPQLPVFFVAMPIQVLGGIALIGATLAAAMTYWMRHFEDTFVGLLGGG